MLIKNITVNPMKNPSYCCHFRHFFRHSVRKPVIFYFNSRLEVIEHIITIINFSAAALSCHSGYYCSPKLD